MKVTVYGPNLPNELTRLGEFHVHQTGCAHTKRGALGRIRLGGDQGGWSIETSSKQEVVEDTYSDQIDESGDDWESYANDFYFAPCTSSLYTKHVTNEEA